MTSDAVAYLEHLAFYTDQITKGVYPQWEPSRDWGFPVEFFMRRIGSFNPFYVLIIVLDFFLNDFVKAYSLFLGIYFFIGMLGFYYLAKLFFGDTKKWPLSHIYC